MKKIKTKKKGSALNPMNWGKRFGDAAADFLLEPDGKKGISNYRRKSKSVGKRVKAKN